MDRAELERRAEAAEEIIETEDNQSDDYIPWWNPEPGDYIAGEIISDELEDTQFDRPQRVLTLDTKDGKLRVRAKTVLEKLLEKQNVQPGETVGFIYDGPREGKNGFTYHAYRLILDRNTNDPALNDPFNGE